MCGLILTSLLSARLVLCSRWFDRSLAHMVERAIEATTGERAVVGQVVVHPWTGRIELDGVVLAERAAGGGSSGTAASPRREAVIGGAEQVTLDLGLPRRGEGWLPSIRRVSVVHPTVRLHLDADGIREFRSGGGSPDSGSGWGGRLPFDRLLIDDGTVTLVGPLGRDGATFTVRLQGVSLVPEGEAKGSGRPHRLDISRLVVDAGGIHEQARKVAVSGIVLGTGGVRIPRIDLAFPDVSVHGRLRWGEGAPDAIRGSVSLRGDLALLQPVLPEGATLAGKAGIEVRVSGTTVHPRFDGALSLDDVIWRPAADGPPLSLPHLSGGWRLDGRYIDAGPLIARWGGGLVEVDGAVDLASWGGWMQLSGAEIRFPALLADAGWDGETWVDGEQDLEVEVGGTFVPLWLAGSFTVAGQRFRVANGDISGHPDTELALPTWQARGAVRLDSSALSLDLDRFVAGGTEGRVQARFGLGEGPDCEIRARFSRLDLADLQPLGGAELMGSGPVTGTVRGDWEDLRFEGHGMLYGAGLLGHKLADRAVVELAPSTAERLTFSRIEAKLGRSAYQGRLEVDFTKGVQLDIQSLIQRGRVADLVGIFAQVPDLDGRVDGTISVSGPPDAMSGEASFTLSEVDLFGEPFVDGEGSVVMHGGAITLERLALRRHVGAESVVARGTLGADDSLRFEVATGGLRLERLHALGKLPLDVRGRFDLDARIEGTVQAPEPHGRIALYGVSVAGEPVAASRVRFETEAGVLKWTGHMLGGTAKVEGRLYLAEPTHPGEAEVDLRRFPAHVLWSVAADTSHVDARLDGKIDLAGNLDDPVGALRIDGRVRRATLVWADHHLASTTPWTWKQRSREVHLADLNLAGGHTRLSVRADRLPDQPWSVRGGGVVDLDLARMVVPDLQRAEGDARIDLSTVDGAPVVEVSLDDAFLQGDWFPQPLEAVQARLWGRPSGYTIERARGRVGGGDWAAVGRIEASGWVPTRYDLTCRVRGARVQYFDFLPPVRGDADLAFDGPVGALLLSGDVKVTDVVFDQRIDWERWVLDVFGNRLEGGASAHEENLFSLDIGIHAAGTVHVRNNLAELTASGDLRVVGDTERPGLVGEVRAMSGGRAWLRDREFEVLRGEVRFVDPYSFDPTLDFLLRTDIQARDRSYRVDYRVLGPYSNWRTETVSDPALPQADINALILFGMTTDDLNRYGGLGSALAAQGGDILASKLGILGRGEQQAGLVLPGALRPDRVDLVSGTNQRGTPTSSSELRLLAEKRLAPNTSLIFEQNLTRASDAYLGFEQRLAQKLYARGYWVGEQEGRHLDIGGAYGAEFRVRWEFD